MSTKKIPADFSISGSALVVKKLIADEVDRLCQSLLLQLSMFTQLPIDKAYTVIVDILVRQACRLALAVAVDLHERTPSKERWLEVCGDVFEEESSSFVASITEQEDRS